MTVTYGPVYGPTYGTVFPLAPLDVAVDLDLGGWTGIAGYVLQREGTSPAITITRGKPDETAQATPSQAQMQWNNRDGRFSPRKPTGPYYGLLNRNTPLRISVPGQATYLRFADDNQSWISCPDSTALQLTGNFDVRIDLDLDDWQPCTLCGKWGGSTALWAWCLVLNDDGTVTLWWSDGTNVNSAQSGPPVPLGRVMIRCYFQASAGQVTFWTAPDMGGSQTQLGPAIAITTADYAQAAATQMVQAGYVDGFIGQGQPTGNSGLLGKVYELQIYNASAALVADPVFTTQTAGATSFADGQGNTWTVDGTAELSARSYRAHLECSGLPQQWDPTGTDVWTPVTASGVLRRLQQGNSPVRSVMRRGVTGDIASVWNVLAYWPCEDAQGSTSIASGLPGGTPMGVSGSPGFQGQAGSPSADSVFACSAQLAQAGTSSWSFTVPAHAAGGSGDAVFFLLGIPSGGISANCELLLLSYSDGNNLTLNYSTAAGGSLSVTGFGPGPGILFNGPAGVNGQALWVRLDTTSGVTDLSVLGVGNTVPADFNAAAGYSGALTGGRVNRYSADLGSTELGHMWASDSPPSLEAYASLLAAYNGETAAFRVARLARENGLDSRVYGYPAVSGAMGPQQIDTLVNILQSCEDNDRGMLYEPAETLGIGYRTQGSLQAQSPAVVLDYSSAMLGGDGSQGLIPTDDDQYLINDVTVSRNNGSSYEFQVTDGPLSVLPPEDGGVGAYDTSLTVYCETDAQLPDIASWMAHIGTADEERYPSIPLNLARSELTSVFYDVLVTRLGDFAQIPDLPAWLPPGPANQLAYGVTEKLGGSWYLLAWNSVPESPYEVAVTDDDVTGRAGTDGSTLASSVSAGATTLSIATTNPASPLWTTDPSDCPFDIEIGGEQITVTAMSGASSPQTATVIRSVNGVSKAQAAGADVALFYPPVLALAA